MDRETWMSAGLWQLVAVTACAAWIGLRIVGLDLDCSSVASIALVCAGLAAGGAYYRLRRRNERIAASLTATAQLIAFSATAACLSYAVARRGGQQWDASFLAWDQALGITWQDWLDYANARPRLSFAAWIAYQSAMPQMIVAVLALCFSGRLAACRSFLLATMLAAIAAIAISGLMPGMTVFMHLDLHQADFPHVPFIDDSHFLAVRDGSLRMLSLAQMQGIIAFPSFHAALGVILACAFWSVPWCRWPGLFLNGAMIAATPTHGGHYVVDVIAGVALGLAAFAAARRIQAAVDANPGPVEAALPAMAQPSTRAGVGSQTVDGNA